MGAKELRIGNWVKYYDDDELSKITVLDHNYCHLNDASSVDYEDIQPIPLTEDILLKCGFIKENYGCFYIEQIDENKNNLWVKTQENNIGVALNFFSSGKRTTYLNNIEYLHQLQNLYFALTNEELTINL